MKNQCKVSASADLERGKRLENFLEKIFPGKSWLARSRELGINDNTVIGWRRGREISGEGLARLHELGCDLYWLLTGREDPEQKQAKQSDSAEAATVDPNPNPDLEPLPAIPVIGLAACGVERWNHPQPLAFSVPAPTGYKNPERLFAVVAVGQSMVPDGIREGYLLYCDPFVKPAAGDAVFVKTTDNKVTVKRLLRTDNQWLSLQGWLEPDKDGVQKPYTDQLALGYIDSIACVVMVRRKA